MISQEIIDLCAEIKKLQNLLKVRDQEVAMLKKKSSDTEEILQEAYRIINDLKNKISHQENDDR